MQPVDFTTLRAVCWELEQHWLPARIEQVYQNDRHTISLSLRTLHGRSWLKISWHPQAARLHLGDPPPRNPDTFTFSKQLQAQLKGLAFSHIAPITPWERALDLQFAPRPQEPAQEHLYVEVMGKYSNVLLVNGANQIVTAAHQVGADQSRVRSIQTGQPFTPPPALQEAVPSLKQSFDQWQTEVSLIPGPIAKILIKAYRGLSSALTRSLVHRAGLAPEWGCDRLSPQDWHRLFDTWQQWLQILDTGAFQPGFTPWGYTVLGWEITEPVATVQELLNRYYGDRLNQHQFQNLSHHLSQKLGHHLQKVRQKAGGFQQRLHQAEGAEQYRTQADLLMAHLHHWQPGLTQMQLPDFETGELVNLPLDPEKTAVQNAQLLYKQHQKLKRARSAVVPLLAAVDQELTYLEQVEASLKALESYQTPQDLRALEEIQTELVQQGYVKDPDDRKRKDPQGSKGDRSGDRSGDRPQKPQFQCYRSPSGLEILVGRNNHQNDYLTFRLANAQDLWFHAQEIPGSHVLLRLQPGTVPEETDLQYAAHVAAYHSRARHSDQAPVVYTEPRHVYKPKGTPPGLVIYKQERVLWGQPGLVQTDSP